MDLSLLWFIQLAPLGAFLLILILPRSLKHTAPTVGTMGALIAALAALKLFWTYRMHETLLVQFVHPWLEVSGGYSLSVGFLLDPLNLLMIALVTVIAFFVQIFSAYYMAEDGSKARYFGFLSFFSFSMTGLVLSNNLLQTFLFWELVGLTSYLLIGFWYQKPSAVDAARKAFVMNRLADLGFYLGIILLFVFFGSVNFTELNSGALEASFSNPFLTLIGILIFMGVMGKSAQFPFHTWLPDAMEGPTPVSALIHSATMVAAGVFLLARSFDLFSASAQTLQVILVVGAVTALIGASVATVQRDIKKILAYSTISQLGLMVMGAGAGSEVSAMFHLSTHAFFKSLLFLTAGAFIHRFHSNDIWQIARGGGKKDLLAMGALILGTLSLCGVFPFSGFFSKDLILEILKEKSIFFYGVGLFVSFLTAYYSFRLLFILLFSKLETHDHEKAHHETATLKLCRAIPLIFLGGISLFVGALGTPLFHQWILHWLGAHPSGAVNTDLLIMTTVLILAAAGIAFWQFRDPRSAELKLQARPGALRNLLEKKFFIDEAYEFLVKQVGFRIAWALNIFDRYAINGFMVNGTSYNILKAGRLFSKLQDGALQNYLSMAIALAAAAIYFLMGGNLFK